MRTVICLLACIAASSAAVEQFKLADGRTFIGEYDDETGQLHTTIAGKPFSLSVAKADIAEREIYSPKKAAKAAADKRAVAMSSEVPGSDVKAAAPKAMSKEEKAASEREFAYGQKVRQADALDADAAKAIRDAAATRKDAARKREEAQRNLRAFRERAQAEGQSIPDEPKILEELVVLPRTSGNNRATIDAWALSKKLDAKAVELDALAEQKRNAATTARGEARMMPRPLAPIAADKP
jgi:hypothetical protein